MKTTHTHTHKKWCRLFYMLNRGNASDKSSMQTFIKWTAKWLKALFKPANKQSENEWVQSVDEGEIITRQISANNTHTYPHLIEFDLSCSHCVRSSSCVLARLFLNQVPIFINSIWFFQNNGYAWFFHVCITNCDKSDTKYVYSKDRNVSQCFAAFALRVKFPDQGKMMEEKHYAGVSIAQMHLQNDSGFFCCCCCLHSFFISVGLFVLHFTLKFLLLCRWT